MLTKTEINDLLQAEQRVRPTSYFDRTLHQLALRTEQRLLSTVAATPINQATMARLTDRVHALQQLRRATNEPSVEKQRTVMSDPDLTDTEIQQLFDQTVSRVTAAGTTTSLERKLLKTCALWLEQRDIRPMHMAESLLKRNRMNALGHQITVCYLEEQRQQL